MGTLGSSLPKMCGEVLELEKVKFCKYEVDTEQLHDKQQSRTTMPPYLVTFLDCIAKE